MSYWAFCRMTRPKTGTSPRRQKSRASNLRLRVQAPDSKLQVNLKSPDKCLLPHFLKIDLLNPHPPVKSVIKSRCRTFLFLLVESKT